MNLIMRNSTYIVLFFAPLFLVGLSNIFPIVNESYVVTFYAETTSGDVSDSFLGHIWVGFQANGEDERRIGFYPAGLQAEPSQADVSYKFTVTKSQFNAALEIIGVYKDNSYILGINDCRSFVREVAGALDLRVPRTGLRSPADWLAELVAVN